MPASSVGPLVEGCQGWLVERDGAFGGELAERDRISGGWRSETGAHGFLAVRSYLSTARKQNQTVLDVLKQPFTDTAWIPANS